MSVGEENLTLQDIAEDLEKERSTVQKAMKQLVEQKLVIRRQKNLEKGGYIFLYTIANKEQTKKRILFLIDSWTSAVKKEIRDW